MPGVTLEEQPLEGPFPPQKMVKSSSQASLTMAQESFKLLLANPTGRHAFFKFLKKESSEENIEFYVCVEDFRNSKKVTVKEARRIFALFVQEGAEKQINISHEEREEISAQLFKPTRDMFDLAQSHVFNLMFTDTYRRFIQLLLQRQAQEELKTGQMGDERKEYLGLGDCFCLTDPSLPDNPIVAASDGFINVTGYTREEVIPFNCRFLQGELTDKETVRRMGQNLRNEREVTELLLNYRKDGTPFWNLLFICPLRDLEGKTRFFLGGQVDVTRNVNYASPIRDVLQTLSSSPSPSSSSSSASASSLSSATSSKPAKKRRGSLFNFLFRRSSSSSSASASSSSSAAIPGAETVTVDPQLDVAQQTDAFLETYTNFIVFDAVQAPGTILFVSDRFSSITGFDPINVVGKTASFLKGQLTSKATLRDLKKAMQQGQSWAKELVAYSASGIPHMCHLFLTPSKGADSRPMFYIAVMKWRFLEDAELEEAKWRHKSEKGEAEECSIQ